MWKILGDDIVEAKSNIELVKVSKIDYPIFLLEVHDEVYKFLFEYRVFLASPIHIPNSSFSLKATDFNFSADLPQLLLPPTVGI